MRQLLLLVQTKQTRLLVASLKAQKQEVSSVPSPGVEHFSFATTRTHGREMETKSKLDFYLLLQDYLHAARVQWNLGIKTTPQWRPKWS